MCHHSAVTGGPQPTVTCRDQKLPESKAKVTLPSASPWEIQAQGEHPGLMFQHLRRAPTVLSDSLLVIHIPPPQTIPQWLPAYIYLFTLPSHHFPVQAPSDSLCFCKLPHPPKNLGSPLDSSVARSQVACFTRD